MNRKEELEKLKSKLIGAIEHEIRTPLSIVKESLSLLTEEVPGKLTSQQKKVILIAKNNIDRLAGSLDNILRGGF